MDWIFNLLGQPLTMSIPFKSFGLKKLKTIKKVDLIFQTWHNWHQQKFYGGDLMI